MFTVDEWTTPAYKISNLSILHADVEDHGGEYTCTGYNPAGHVTASIQLSMLRGMQEYYVSQEKHFNKFQDFDTLKYFLILY